MTEYVIFLNDTEDAEGRLAIFARMRDENLYEPGDKLLVVAAGTLPDGVGIDALFPMYNRGAPGFVGDTAYPHRSLSAGDVVLFGGDWFLCDRIGWKPIDPPMTAASARFAAALHGNDADEITAAGEAVHNEWLARAEEAEREETERVSKSYAHLDERKEF